MLKKIVTIPNYEIRAEARSLLRGYWKTAVLCTLVYMILINLPVWTIDRFLSENASNFFSFVYFIVLGGPLIFGYTLFALKRSRGENAEISDLFEGFNHFGSAVLLNFLITFFTVLWSLLFIIPGIIAALRYSQAFYILIENPNLSPTEAINQSKKMMRGNIGKLFLLVLSFIGWIILSVLTIGIGSLWLTPYIFVTISVFYNELVEWKKEEILEDKIAEQTDTMPHNEDL